MTHPTQESLDEAARKAGYRDWNDARPRSGSGASIIRNHATTLDEFAAYKQEVSDAVHQRFNYNRPQYGCLERFILPKPDPLVEALAEAYNNDSDELDAANVREAIEKRGGKIVWGEG